MGMGCTGNEGVGTSGDEGLGVAGGGNTTIDSGVGSKNPGVAVGETVVDIGVGVGSCVGMGSLASTGNWKTLGVTPLAVIETVGVISSMANSVFSTSGFARPPRKM